MTNPKIKWSDPVTGLDGIIAVAHPMKDGKLVQAKETPEEVVAAIDTAIARERG